MVAWCYNVLVEETVRWFVRRAVPDAGDWEACTYMVFNDAVEAEVDLYQEDVTLFMKDGEVYYLPPEG